RPFVADALAPADGGRQAQGAVAGEPGGGDPDGGDEAVRSRPCCDRHHGTAEGGDVSDQRQTAQPGTRAAGATDEEARREPAPMPISSSAPTAAYASSRPISAVSSATSSGALSGMKICGKRSYGRCSWPGACWNRSAASAAARSIPYTRQRSSASVRAKRTDLT